MVPMGVDREKLLLQADKLEEKLMQLADAARQERADFIGDDMMVSATERHIQIAVECCLNIGNHLIAGLGFKRADSYAGVFTRLVEARLINPELGEILRQAARFRNRIVHLYIELTPDEVHDFCVDSAPRLGEFVEEVFKYLRAEGHLQGG